MGTDFGAAMPQALQLVRSQNVSEATRVIQRALVDRVGDASPVDNPRERGLIPPPSSEIIGTAEAVEPALARVIDRRRVASPLDERALDDPRRLRHILRANEL